MRDKIINPIFIPIMDIKAVIFELREKDDPTTAVKQIVGTRNVFGGIETIPSVFKGIYEERDYEQRALVMTQDGKQRELIGWCKSFPKKKEKYKFVCKVKPDFYGIDVVVALKDAPLNIEAIEIYRRGRPTKTSYGKPSVTISGGHAQWRWNAKPRQRAYFYVRAIDSNGCASEFISLGLYTVKVPTKRSQLDKSKPSKSKIKGKMELV